MIENWVILAFFAGISSQLFNFLNRFLLKDGDNPISLGWFSEFFKLVISALILIFTFKSNPSLTLPAYFYLLALGLVNILSVYFFFKMHSLTELSLSSIIARSRLIWVPILAFIFLGEILDLNQYLGILILFIGLSTAVATKKIFADKGIFYSFLASVLIAIISIIMKIVTPLASPAQIMIFMALPTVVVLPFFMKKNIQKIKTEFKTHFCYKVLAFSANLLAMYLMLLALQTGPVGIITAIYQGMMIFAVLAGIFLLQEKKNLTQKIIGSLITLIGILLLTLL